MKTGKVFLLLAAAFLLALGPVLGSAAAESGVFGNLTWELNKGVLTVSGSGSFPANGPWMEYAKKIKKIEIGDGIESVDNGAISGLPALTSIDFGAGVRGVSYFTMKDVPKLKSIRLGGKVNQFGLSVRLNEIVLDNPESSFIVRDGYVTDTNGSMAAYCIGSRKGTVELPAGFKRVSMYSFVGMTGMKELILHDKVTGIFDGAFQGCTGLQSMTIPASVATMTKRVFDGCKALKQVIFLGEKITLSETFSGCSGLQEIVLPAVEQIPGNCFRDCAALRTAVLGEGTLEIRKDAFRGCTALTEVWLPASLTAIDEEAFDPDSHPVFICPAGSYADSFLRDHGFQVENPARVESVALSESEMTLEKGKSAKLEAAVLPETGVRGVIWVSSDPLTVSLKDGKIKALRGGSSEIFCMAADGSGVRAVCRVEVSEAVKSLAPAEKKHAMVVGDTWQPAVAVKPETATNQTLSWSSSDDAVCTVDESGTVTAVSAGKCSILCSATDGSGKTAKIAVQVKAE